VHLSSGVVAMIESKMD